MTRRCTPFIGIGRIKTFFVYRFFFHKFIGIYTIRFGNDNNKYNNILLYYYYYVHLYDFRIVAVSPSSVHCTNWRFGRHTHTHTHTHRMVRVYSNKRARSVSDESVNPRPELTLVRNSNLSWTQCHSAYLQ